MLHIDTLIHSHQEQLSSMYIARIIVDLTGTMDINTTRALVLFGDGSLVTGRAEFGSGGIGWFTSDFDLKYLTATS